jgi:hypothetical protein
MSMVALYYISTVSPKWPYVTPGTGIKIAVALALALNIRVGALVYLGYFGLLVLAFVVAERCTDWRRLADTAARLAGVTAGVLLLGTLFWPWAQAAPLTRPIQALIGLSNFPWDSGIVFNGRNYTALSLPWYYPLEWLLISTPPVVIAGVILSVLVVRNREWAIRNAALWIVLILPLALVITRDSTLYDGIRHLLFIYPIVALLAASGWTAALLATQRARPWLRTGTAALLAVGLINVVAFDIRFHPNQTVYFNELVGGPRGAFGKFDMDYWGNCMLEAVVWSAKTAKLSGRPIGISGNPWHLVQLNAERFPHLLYFVPPHRRQYHLDVRLNRGSKEGMAELANRGDALYRVVTADGVVLCAVLPGPAFAQLQPYLSLPSATEDSRLSKIR